MPLSVTELIVPVPDDFVIVTVAPPLVRLLPFASSAWTVRTCVETPFAAIDELVGVNVDLAALTAPERYVTVACVCDPPPLNTFEPPRVATKVPLPTAAGEVTVAVYVPLLWSVTVPIVPVPEDLVIVTVAPPVVRLLPLASLACTVSICVEVPLATIDDVVGVNVD